jgi:hypothetical protein
MVLSPPTPQIPGHCYLNVEKAGTVLNTLFYLFNCAESAWVANLVQVVAKLANPPQILHKMPVFALDPWPLLSECGPAKADSDS